MKNIFLILNTSIILCLFSCESNLLFDGPEPMSGEMYESLPLELQGRYLVEGDSSIVIAEWNSVLWMGHQTYEMFFQEDTVGLENCNINEKKIFKPENGKCLSFEYTDKEGVVEIVEYDIDTVFSFTENEMLINYNGMYFFNKESEEGSGWTVWMVAPEQNGAFTLRLFDWEEEEGELKKWIKKMEVVEDPVRGTVYSVNPTPEEFEKLISRFSEKECELLIPYNYESESFY